MKNGGKKGFSLYQKFALVIILAGVLPVALLATVIMEWMFREHEASLVENYTQGLRYASRSLEQLFDGYNDISKFSYYYSYSSEGNFAYDYIHYDNLRQILTGENYPEEEREQRTRQEMNTFLGNVIKTSSATEEAHFLYWPEEGEMVDYHAGNYNTRFTSLPLFMEMLGDTLDTESRQLIILPTHSFDYVQNSSRRVGQVFTVARNYFNLQGVVGQEKYVGTLLLDLDVGQIAGIFEGFDLYQRASLYVTNTAGDCLYSTLPEFIGLDLEEAGAEYAASPENGLLLTQHIEKYGLVLTLALDGPIIEGQMRSIQTLMYVLVLLAVLILSLASFSFSSRLTKPIRVMMERMADIETGRFEGQLPVTSKDEVGQLAERFNQMSTELRNYTNQAYVSKIKQKEAELNALKSQIYPHFLYNTLEVIRMTAVTGGDETVANMVEALGDQIHYLIGTVGDVVPLGTEIEIMEKYIYLVNCRYGGRITFTVDTGGLEGQYIPKLILQPLVENAFIHGLKNKIGQGRIQLDAQVAGGELTITVLDDGQGMSAEAVERLENILESPLPGEKTETGWKSIGLKNVHDRLRYLYGEAYGISLFSTPGAGTAIKVTLPAGIQPKEEEHAADDTGR